jgi:predicted N-acetyltransferase YhbS
MITTRSYTGAADLRRMQRVVSQAFGRGIDHVGDLAWGMRTLPHIALAPLITLAEDGDGAPLGWMWFHVNGWFDVIAPSGDAELLDALLTAAAQTATRMQAAGDDMPHLRVLCATDDDALSHTAKRHGFTPLDGITLEVNRRTLDDLPEPRVPDGFTLTHVDDAHVDARVEAHRAAFPPSALTAHGFRRVRATWPYREQLDRMAVTTGGRVVSSCLAWIDEDTQWGLLEPVGTDPEFQRRGLATAVCLDALHALRNAGARAAQVGCESGSAGGRTYHGIGFETVRTMQVLHRPLTG